MYQFPLIIAVLLPSIFVYGDMRCVKLPMFTCWILAFLISILCSPMSKSIKTAFILLILCAYWRNLDLLLNLVMELYHPSKYSAFTIDCARLVLNRHFSIIDNFSSLLNQPTIFICNYAKDRFENTLLLYLPRKLTILASEEFVEYTGVNTIIPTITIPKRGGYYNTLQKQLEQELAKGRSVICYSQKPLYIDGKNYGKFHTGVLKLAKLRGLPITPLYIEAIKSEFGGIYNQPIRFIVDKTIRVTNVSHTISHIKAFYKRMIHLYEINDISDV